MKILCEISTKGRKQSKETREKLRLAHLGKKHSANTIKLLSIQRKGVPKSKEHIKKMRLRMLGDKNPMKGKHHSEETKKKWKRKGENNSNWRGCKSVQQIHRWVVNEKGKAKNYICECCKKKQATEWSNIDHKYKKDLRDFRALCRSCHQKWDGKYLNVRRKIIKTI